MANELERHRLVRLLEQVLPVYEADLPGSKTRANAEIQKSWAKSKALEFHKNQVRDFHDDLCIEVGLLCMHLGILSPEPSVPVELGEIIKALLDELETLVNTRLKSTPSRRSMYPGLHALRLKLKEAKKRNQSINALDEDCEGLVNLNTTSEKHDLCLAKLRRCRRKLVKLAHITDLATPICDDKNLMETQLRDVFLQEGPALTYEIRGLQDLAAALETCSRSANHATYLALISLGAVDLRMRRAKLLVDPHAPEMFVELEAIQQTDRRGTVRRGKVRFLDDIPGDEISRTSQEQEVASGGPTLYYTTLCDLLRECGHSLDTYAWILRLPSNTRSGPWRAVAARPNEVPQFVSLEFLLCEGLIAIKAERLALMTTLVRCFLDLMGEETGWHRTKKSVMFNTHYRSSSNEVDITQPYLGIPPMPFFQSLSSLSINRLAPALLDLGVLLLEIHRGTVLSSDGELRVDHEQVSESPAYNEYITAWRIIEQPDFDKSVGRNIAAAVRACLRCDFFPCNVEEEPKNIRRLVYQRILQPLLLEELLIDDEQTHESGSEGEEEETDHSQTGLVPEEQGPTSGPIAFMSTPVEGSHIWRVFDENPFSDAEIRSADAWFEKLKGYQTRVLEPLWESSRYKAENDKRTKVAVLDTGLDLRDAFVRGAKGRIKEMRNWVPDDKGIVNTKNVDDLYGHGTHTAALVLKVAPCADICVARIANGKMLEAGEIYIAEAIIWASETCNADIITMSFGFPRSSDVVEEALVRAYARRPSGTIMFAATGNDGIHENIAYPANHRNVIGVFSTDGKGNKSDFNPNPPTEDDSFFGTLGEAVESSWPKRLRTDKDRQETTMRKSGTSFATPIVAAMAANMLDYARLQLDLGDKYMKRLHTFAKMLAVLKLMASKRDGYNVIEPWLLWKCDEYASDAELQLERESVRIRILLELGT